MAEGVNYLLTAGILHTNLHGRNVLVSHKHRAKIADYICPQVIPLVDNSTDQTYLAPEVVKSKHPPTISSAVFSLGVLCLQTVTAHPPYPINELESLGTEQWMMEVPEVHPLLPVIQQCINDSAESRPIASEVCTAIANAKNSV